MEICERTKCEIILSIYGRMQMELVAIELVDDLTGKPKPAKKLNLNEQDGLHIYKYLFSKIEYLTVDQVEKYSQRTNDILKKLLNDKEAPVNNYLMSMMLYRNYLQDIAPKAEQIMLLPKVERSIQLFETFESDEYKQIRKNTGRATDNIWRTFIGRPQLSDEVRDARFKRIVK